MDRPGGWKSRERLGRECGSMLVNQGQVLPLVFFSMIEGDLFDA